MHGVVPLLAAMDERLQENAWAYNRDKIWKMGSYLSRR
jgi:hypothetical protein